jgi:hypothetical protein
MNCINANILVRILPYSFKHVIGGNWTKVTQDLSVLFLTTVCDSPIISKVKVFYGRDLRFDEKYKTKLVLSI